jgi:hypothetical protein
MNFAVGAITLTEILNTTENENMRDFLQITPIPIP